MSEVVYTLLINGSPADSELLEAIEEIQVESSSEMADAFRVRFCIGMSDKSDWTTLQEDYFKEQFTPITILIQIGTGISEPLITGFTSLQYPSFGNVPGQSTYEIVGMDATAKMNMEEKQHAWPNMAHHVIAEQVFGNYKDSIRQTKIDKTKVTPDARNEITLQRETDIQFLRRLARMNGFECYVETDPHTGLNTGYFCSPRTDGETQKTMSVNFSEETNVCSFNARYDMLKPVSTQTTNLDLGGGSIQSGLADSDSATALGRKGLLDESAQKRIVLPSQTGLSTASELQTLAKAITDRSAWAITAEGELDGAVYGEILRCHRIVRVQGAGSQFNGDYRIKSVLHTITGNNYSQRFRLERNALGMNDKTLF